MNKELEQFLKDNPELLSLQKNIEKNLRSKKNQEDRLEYLALLLRYSVLELNVEVKELARKLKEYND